MRTRGPSVLRLGIEIATDQHLDYRLANPLNRAGLHPGGQVLDAEPLYPMSEDELHRRLHGHALTYDEREEIKRGLRELGLIMQG
jgi:hypothetical protein